MSEAPGFRVEVVSPERVVFSGETTQIITRTIGGGEIAFLPGHTSFLGALTENHTRVWLSDGTIMNLAIHGGFVEVSDNVVTLLSDGAELGSEIDIERARRALERAEELTRTENSTEVEASLRRAHARLAAAGGLAGVNAGH
ncbi:MAG: ATP synthase F1 subunit epsilon [Actinobacteria bacterium]|jgi:F-type H+-transporting ATPase subunit epsilon|nr:ATP synthase F1 subunit epsilon [Actinomycetota bacterium]